MRPFEGERRDDYVFIPLLFTEITPRLLEDAKNRFLEQTALVPQGPVNTLFIGNSSAKIRFSDADWDGIIRFVNEEWKREGRQWLVTTSYRTGTALEERFRRGLDPEALLDAVWYGSKPRKVTKPFLALASRVYVTMDSLTMLTEAVTSGRPAYALCPEESAAEESNTHIRYVHELAEKGLIGRIRPGNADGEPPSEPRFGGKIDYSASISELLEKIGWKP